MSDFETKAKYERFAKAYEFYFDKSTRFMRGLDSKGEWRTPFNPRASTHRSDDYCEGTALAMDLVCTSRCRWIG